MQLTSTLFLCGKFTWSCFSRMHGTDRYERTNANREYLRTILIRATRNAAIVSRKSDVVRDLRKPALQADHARGAIESANPRASATIGVTDQTRTEVSVSDPNAQLTGTNENESVPNTPTRDLKGSGNGTFIDS